MTAVAAEFFDGQRPLAEPVSITVTGDQLVVTGETVAQHVPTSAVLVSPRIAQAKRFVQLPRGGRLLCDDGAWLDVLPSEVRAEGLVAWLEQRWGFALASVWLIGLSLVLGYFYGLPAAALAIAERIPSSTEQALGQRLLAALDAQHVMRPSTVDRFVAQEVRDEFAKLIPNDPRGRCVQLEMRASFIGANALTLPGGIVVVTDDLVRLVTPEELSAVLAHELGHVEGRHSMRALIQSSGVGLIVAVITGDASSATAALGTVTAVLNASYSRDMETQADAFAFKLLDEHGISPNAFATAMERLSQQAGARPGSNSFFDSHPATEERIRRAREAATKKKP
ncbi:MAG TPA: M48 family metallopeptidase [Polyangiaceae bacterium]|jgi:Zn-dependent protease with chaperone function|nr:M48 family metallopeptidase [Polyangiaceae bacterium]